ncbi:hypothetical protein HRE53_31715 (plasmid) [Acaryochloris sp. 'Moss Beach']|uniref:hypothetical protein n=1 Tax=Acaryochloris sp. 'Moss Beach' TaxID=2740837 RepID=UPI001F3F871E|nr:hypothetical protein [Acaryochloris sp. 'Moss Beach']UJB73261.1 hypothetical protein HRE53_31715 [Acaryochloris sp. 'Moss Beach']
MARFREQVNKGIEQEPETKNQKPETRNQKPEAKLIEKTPILSYTDEDMEAVNVAGFKVPYIVREHWKKRCREKRVKLSPILKEFLVNEFGLPPGISIDDI